MTKLRLAWLVLVCSFLAVAPAAANDSQGNVQYGSGLVCDTAEQIKSVISSSDMQATIARINAGSNACGIVTVAFQRGEKVGEVTQGAMIFDIIRITVVGSFNGQWLPMSPLVQFTAFGRHAQDI